MMYRNVILILMFVYQIPAYSKVPKTNGSSNDGFIKRLMRERNHLNLEDAIENKNGERKIMNGKIHNLTKNFNSSLKKTLHKSIEIKNVATENVLETFLDTSNEDYGDIDIDDVVIVTETPEIEIKNESFVNFNIEYEDSTEEAVLIVMTTQKEGIDKSSAKGKISTQNILEKVRKKTKTSDSSYVTNKFSKSLTTATNQNSSVSTFDDHVSSANPNGVSYPPPPTTKPKSFERDITSTEVKITQSTQDTELQRSDKEVTNHLDTATQTVTSSETDLSNAEKDRTKTTATSTHPSGTRKFTMNENTIINHSTATQNNGNIIEHTTIQSLSKIFSTDDTNSLKFSKTNSMTHKRVADRYSTIPQSSNYSGSPAETHQHSMTSKKTESTKTEQSLFKKAVSNGSPTDTQQSNIMELSTDETLNYQNSTVTQLFGSSKTKNVATAIQSSKSKHNNDNAELNKKDETGHYYTVARLSGSSEPSKSNEKATSTHFPEIDKFRTNKKYPHSSSTVTQPLEFSRTFIAESRKSRGNNVYTSTESSRREESMTEIKSSETGESGKEETLIDIQSTVTQLDYTSTSTHPLETAGIVSTNKESRIEHFKINSSSTQPSQTGTFHRNDSFTVTQSTERDSDDMPISTLSSDALTVRPLESSEKVIETDSSRTQKEENNYVAPETHSSKTGNSTNDGESRKDYSTVTQTSKSTTQDFKAEHFGTGNRDRVSTATQTRDNKHEIYSVPQSSPIQHSRREKRSTNDNSASTQFSYKLRTDKKQTNNYRTTAHSIERKNSNMNEGITVDYFTKAIRSSKVEHSGADEETKSGTTSTEAIVTDTFRAKEKSNYSLSTTHSKTGLSKSGDKKLGTVNADEKLSNVYSTVKPPSTSKRVLNSEHLTKEMNKSNDLTEEYSTKKKSSYHYSPVIQSMTINFSTATHSSQPPKSGSGDEVTEDLSPNTQSVKTEKINITTKSENDLSTVTQSFRTDTQSSKSEKLKSGEKVVSNFSGTTQSLKPDKFNTTGKIANHLLTATHSSKLEKSEGGDKVTNVLSTTSQSYYYTRSSNTEKSEGYEMVASDFSATTKSLNTDKFKTAGKTKNDFSTATQSTSIVKPRGSNDLSKTTQSVKTDTQTSQTEKSESNKEVASDMSVTIQSLKPVKIYTAEEMTNNFSTATQSSKSAKSSSIYEEANDLSATTQSVKTEKFKTTKELENNYSISAVTQADTQSSKIEKSDNGGEMASELSAITHSLKPVKFNTGEEMKTNFSKAIKSSKTSKSESGDEVRDHFAIAQPVKTEKFNTITKLENDYSISTVTQSSRTDIQFSKTEKLESGERVPNDFYGTTQSLKPDKFKTAAKITNNFPTAARFSKTAKYGSDNEVPNDLSATTKSVRAEKFNTNKKFENKYFISTVTQSSKADTQFPASTQFLKTDKIKTTGKLGDFYSIVTQPSRNEGEMTNDCSTVTQSLETDEFKTAEKLENYYSAVTQSPETDTQSSETERSKSAVKVTNYFSISRSLRTDKFNTTGKLRNDYYTVTQTSETDTEPSKPKTIFSKTKKSGSRQEVTNDSFATTRSSKTDLFNSVEKLENDYSIATQSSKRENQSSKNDYVVSATTQSSKREKLNTAGKLENDYPKITQSRRAGSETQYSRKDVTTDGNTSTHPLEKSTEESRNNYSSSREDFETEKSREDKIKDDVATSTHSLQQITDHTSGNYSTVTQSSESSKQYLASTNAKLFTKHAITDILTSARSGRDSTHTVYSQKSEKVTQSLGRSGKSSQTRKFETDGKPTVTHSFESSSTGLENFKIATSTLPSKTDQNKSDVEMTNHYTATQLATFSGNSETYKKATGNISIVIPLSKIETLRTNRQKTNDYSTVAKISESIDRQNFHTSAQEGISVPTFTQSSEATKSKTDETHTKHYSVTTQPVKPEKSENEKKLTATNSTVTQSIENEHSITDEHIIDNAPTFTHSSETEEDMTTEKIKSDHVTVTQSSESAEHDKRGETTNCSTVPQVLKSSVTSKLYGETTVDVHRTTESSETNKVDTDKNSTVIQPNAEIIEKERIDVSTATQSPDTEKSKTDEKLAGYNAASTESSKTEKSEKDEKLTDTHSTVKQSTEFSDKHSIIDEHIVDDASTSTHSSEKEKYGTDENYSTVKQSLKFSKTEHNKRNETEHYSTAMQLLLSSDITKSDENSTLDSYKPTNSNSDKFRTFDKGTDDYYTATSEFSRTFNAENNRDERIDAPDKKFTKFYAVNTESSETVKFVEQKKNTNFSSTVTHSTELFKVLDEHTPLSRMEHEKKYETNSTATQSLGYLPTSKSDGNTTFDAYTATQSTDKYTGEKGTTNVSTSTQSTIHSELNEYTTEERIAEILITDISSSRTKLGIENFRSDKILSITSSIKNKDTHIQKTTETNANNENFKTETTADMPIVIIPILTNNSSISNTTRSENETTIIEKTNKNITEITEILETEKDDSNDMNSALKYGVLGGIAGAIGAVISQIVKIVQNLLKEDNNNDNNTNNDDNENKDNNEENTNTTEGGQNTKTVVEYLEDDIKNETEKIEVGIKNKIGETEDKIMGKIQDKITNVEDSVMHTITGKLTETRDIVLGDLKQQILHGDGTILHNVRTAFTSSEHNILKNVGGRLKEAKSGLINDVKTSFNEAVQKDKTLSKISNYTTKITHHEPLHEIDNLKRRLSETEQTIQNKIEDRITKTENTITQNLQENINKTEKQIVNNIKLGVEDDRLLQNVRLMIAESQKQMMQSITVKFAEIKLLLSTTVRSDINKIIVESEDVIKRRTSWPITLETINEKTYTLKNLTGAGTSKLSTNITELIKLDKTSNSSGNLAGTSMLLNNLARSSKLSPNLTEKSEQSRILAGASPNLSTNPINSSNLMKNLTKTSKSSLNLIGNTGPLTNSTRTPTDPENASNLAGTSKLPSNLTESKARSSKLSKNLCGSSNMTTNLADTSKMSSSLTGISKLSKNSVRSSKMPESLESSSNLTESQKLHENLTESSKLPVKLTECSNSSKNLSETSALVTKEKIKQDSVSLKVDLDHSIENIEYIVENPKIPSDVSCWR